jgi:hypothetical protein
MLNPDLKARWIADLRANPQLQTTGKLQNHEGKNCCLGRLCLLQEIPWYGKYFVFPTELSNSMLPTLYCKEIDIPVGIRNILMDMNDKLKLTFPEIADFIESSTEI